MTEAIGAVSRERGSGPPEDAGRRGHHPPADTPSDALPKRTAIIARAEHVVGGPKDIAPGDAPEMTEKAAGVWKEAIERKSLGWCHDYKFRTANIGGAHSHIARTGHTVEVDYRSRFRFSRPEFAEGLAVVPL
jgi:hypothetical protein